MKTFWIILLVALLVLIIIQAIRGRRCSSVSYRARFFNRMPRDQRPEPNRRSNAEDATYLASVIFGAARDGAHAPASAPDCAPGATDAGGACSVGDGGGSTS